MEKKVVSGIMLTLLMFVMLTVTLSIQPVKTDLYAQLLLETDKDVYILGENVTIIHTNIGSETVEIGGYPAWEIYTYPEEETVYPAIFAFLLWWLEPGENDTITWNQYNQFNNSFCGPGTYVVKDLQGWGLSAYFEIVPTEEQWVPYVPSPEQWWVNEWSLVYWMENETSYVDVNLVWPSTGYAVSNWGTPVKDGYNTSVDTEMWVWTGFSLPVIIYQSHTYNLGYLEAGNYRFTFKVWGHSVKSIDFVVELNGDVDDDGDVDFDDFTIFSGCYGTSIEDPRYDPRADFNEDGCIDFDDFIILAGNYGGSL